MLEMFKKRDKPEEVSELQPHEPAVPGHDRDLHPRAALPVEPGARAAREPDRRGRHARRDRGHLRAEAASTSYWAIALGMLIGGGFGAFAARRVKMTAMPQMVALFNGVGGGAAALVSLAELHRILPEPGTPKVDIGLAIVLSALIGSISFAGSMIAFAKLQELIGGRPITYAGPAVRQRGALPRVCGCGTRARCGRAARMAAVGARRRRGRSSGSCSSCRSAAPTCRS